MLLDALIEFVFIVPHSFSSYNSLTAIRLSGNKDLLYSARASRSRLHSADPGAKLKPILSLSEMFFIFLDPL